MEIEDKRGKGRDINELESEDGKGENMSGSGKAGMGGKGK